MRTIYIDSDFLCYTENAEGRTAIETDAFDGKCKAYIEGYRYVPQGQTWTREDGKVFNGLMITAAVNYNILAEAQRNYEEGIDSMDSTIGGLMDDIEELCNELIGE